MRFDGVCHRLYGFCLSPIDFGALFKMSDVVYTVCTYILYLGSYEECIYQTLFLGAVILIGMN